MNMGGWTGGPAAAAPIAPVTPSYAAPTTMTNFAADSPLLGEQVGQVRERLGVDTTQRAIDRSNLGIADSAALLAKDRKANLSSRGILGTEAADAYLDKNVFNPAQAAAAGAAADISMGEERRKDALVLGASGIYQAPDQLNLANRRLNLDQFSAQSADAARRADAEQRARESREDIERSRYLAMQSLNSPAASGGGYTPPPRSPYGTPMAGVRR